jgi:hypothetical protein
MANTTTKTMLLTLQSHSKLNNGVEIPLLGLGVYHPLACTWDEHRDMEGNG